MSQHVVITGANRGIGLQLAKIYKTAGAKVIAVVRRSSDELDELGVDVRTGFDVSHADDVARLRTELKDEHIDLLINNAGVFRNETLAEMNFDTINEQLSVNAVAPVRVTHALRDNFSKGAKVAMITSRMGSIADNGSGGYIGYRMSKAALNAASVSLAHELKAQDVAVGLIHPGFVQTEMVGYAGDIGPDVAAQRISERIDELNLNNSGGFWHANGETLPW
ncbi:C-factor [Pseudoalteromonas sp. THAF3]|uniref:KR domain-containing protein n=1 Tax=Pseudoalteromonas ruthenica TaxID=151081 RepID=A0A5S3YZZ1_9GAMM|nr:MULTISPECIES: SDR family oxidoreductase [Pseudoalteromonas]QFU03498.1 C-factor [Pseudoalteromonas sp. THAF3]TLX49658.1 KR domain-containing protein [Pseudoalteromonas ruthenica]TMP85574.1 KR domain-containing protein [Pseudoalteromonas ruthenica]GAP77134.1 short-chain dehydrogenase/reductase SDR superfamily [Pseudoalteromonas sp. SW0106-04]